MGPHGLPQTSSDDTSLPGFTPTPHTLPAAGPRPSLTLSPISAGRGAPSGPGVVSSVEPAALAGGASSRGPERGGAPGTRVAGTRGEPGGWQREHSPALQRVPWEPGHLELAAGYGSAWRKGGQGTRQWEWGEQGKKGLGRSQLTEPGEACREGFARQMATPTLCWGFQDPPWMGRPL